MADQKCIECGSVLSIGLAEPTERAGIGAWVGPRYDCANCGWSSVADVPGTEGGDNGGG